LRPLVKITPIALINLLFLIILVSLSIVLKGEQQAFAQEEYFTYASDDYALESSIEGELYPYSQQLSQQYLNGYQQYLKETLKSSLSNPDNTTLNLIPVQGTVLEYRIKSDAEKSTEETNETPPPIIEREVEKGTQIQNTEKARLSEEPKKQPDNGNTNNTSEQKSPSASQSTSTPKGKASQNSENVTKTTPQNTQSSEKPNITGPRVINPGVELTLDNIEETLVFPENQEISYGDSLLIWKDNKLYRKNEDGSLSLLDSS
jgi:hypothetical protein